MAYCLYRNDKILLLLIIYTRRRVVKKVSCVYTVCTAYVSEFFQIGDQIFLCISIFHKNGFISPLHDKMVYDGSTVLFAPTWFWIVNFNCASILIIKLCMYLVTSFTMQACPSSTIWLADEKNQWTLPTIDNVCYFIQVNMLFINIV